ncbi:hypothetical protein, partial [Mesorhizobium japonicum]|uniref:hypothetical protein n=1 Tax=Mesorhizobium japonicum TaxID=2066070 RepID=UPI003B5CCC61
GARIAVPSSWPMQEAAPASERPWYTNTRFPFPVDPPHVPDADAIADHAVGDTVTIGWIDASGAAHQADVTLVAGPAA